MNRLTTRRDLLGAGAQALGPHRVRRIGRILYEAGASYQGNEIQSNGEAALQNALRSVIASEVVMDVGANVGRWTQALVSGGASPSRIICVEADPSTAALLRSTVQSSGPTRVDVVERALSDYEGTASFISYGAGVGANSLIAHVRGADSLPLERRFTVPVGTGDALCDELKVEHLALVKIDAEGSDLAVLRGFSRRLSNGELSAVQFEYNSRWIGSRSFLKDVFDLLDGADLVIGRLSYSRVLLFDRWVPELECFRQSNYVILNAEARAALVRSRFLDHYR